LNPVLQSAPTQPGTAPCTPTARIIVALLLLIFVLQCAWFIRTQSFTNDEPEHLVAGLEAWRFGEFKQWHDQPPLGRLLFSLPLINTNWQYRYIDEQVHLVAPAPEVWLYRARPVSVVFGVALLLLLWAAARRLFSETTAHFVLAFAVLSPDLIAHFSLATIDGIGCLCVFACVFQWMRYWHNPSRRNAAILGALLGLLLLAKFNSPPLVALALLLVLMLAPSQLRFNPRGLQWRRTAAILFIACLVLWSGYFFHVSRVTFADQMVTIHFSGYTKLLQYEMPTLNTPITIFWPACEWFTGLGMVVFHNMEGHRSFFLGQYPTAGVKLYFPVAMVLKWPLIVLLLAAAGAYAAIRRRIPASRDLLLMSIFPAVYFFFAVTARINIGIRHVLPLYPFLLLYAGAAIEWARRASATGAPASATGAPASATGAASLAAYPPASATGAASLAAYPPASATGAASLAAYPPASATGAAPAAYLPASAIESIPRGCPISAAFGRCGTPRFAGIFLVTLLVAQAADIARYAPDYLSYFSVLVRSANTWQLLSDSNTDWGQGFVALRQFQAAHPNEPIHLAYVGETDPAWYGIRYTRLHEEDRPTGIVIVSATHLSGQLLKNHYAYRWLLQYPLKTILNHTLYVFDVPAQPTQP
jgi:hypothetical protein